MNNRSVNRNNISWLTGFFEGEGHIGICKRMYTKQGHQLYLQVTVTNNDESLLVPFLFYGGRIIRTSKKWLALRWYISSRKAADFLQVIHPYLKGKKKKQAELAIKFQSLVGLSGKPVDEEKWQQRLLLYTEINELNAKKGGGVRIGQRDNPGKIR